MTQWIQNEATFKTKAGELRAMEIRYAVGDSTVPDLNGAALRDAHKRYLRRIRELTAVRKKSPTEFA